MSKQLIIKSEVIKLNIKKWYVETYPSDELGAFLSDNVSFLSLYHAITNSIDVYNLLNVSDSLTRERVFLKLSQLLNIEYETIYELWI